MKSRFFLLFLSQTKKMNNFLTEQENKIIRLVEERGVAAFPYKTVIKEIVNYCQTQTRSLKPGDKTNFTIL